MDKHYKVLLEEIRDSYIAMHTTLYMVYIIKVDKKKWNFINNALMKPIPYNITFENGSTYLLRKEYIKHGLETSTFKRLEFGIMWDISIIHTFANIISNFRELLNDTNFKSFINNKLKSKEIDFDSFDSIIRLVRNIASHWSLSKEYCLKNNDFSDWKRHHNRMHIDRIKLELNVNDNESINIDFKVSEIKEWLKFSTIFTSYDMISFIEFCMSSIYFYENDSQ